MKHEKMLLKISEMGFEEFNDPTTYHEIHCPAGAGVRLSGVMFDDNIISRIKISKPNLSSKQEKIFVTVYMGNVNIATEIYNSDAVVYFEYRDDEQKKLRTINIDRAQRYDY